MASSISYALSASTGSASRPSSYFIAKAKSRDQNRKTLVSSSSLVSKKLRSHSHPARSRSCSCSCRRLILCCQEMETGIRRLPVTYDSKPRNILEEIIWSKNGEVAKMKEVLPLEALKQSLSNVPPPKDFLGALKLRAAETNLPALIAEVKKASPSRGVIQPNFDPVQIAHAYERGGAACLSVLTDSKYFQGSFENIQAIRNAGIMCPLLCKEFIIDPYQIYYARLKGADAVLLITAVLSDEEINDLLRICRSLDMTALIEVHSTEELDRVRGIEGVELIGINNRDLGTFHVDKHNTEKLLQGDRGHHIRARDIIVVGESGLFTPDDVKLVHNAGVRAILVGESLVRESDPAAGIANLFGIDISRKLEVEKSAV
eukprot:TRINITY_DN31218_c0_g1_i1.p1 TRINITY_DN31218_c0_g1~~TRINITY_DN31218_c0_g1_i1.p1  ORF type:complete len:374 (-),score=78.87 TRINITY_DN31218_c0_g1_i1:105-1226(-)